VRVKGRPGPHHAGSGTALCRPPGGPRRLPPRSAGPARRHGIGSVRRPGPPLGGGFPDLSHPDAGTAPFAVATTRASASGRRGRRARRLVPHGFRAGPYSD